MSYSFNFRAESKDAARVMIATELSKVVEQQPIHAADCDQAEANALAALDIIPDPDDGEEVSMAVNGYVQWRGVMGGEPPAVVNGVSINVNAQIVAKLPAS